MAAVLRRMETPSQKLEGPAVSRKPRRGLDAGPFPYREAFPPKQFVAPESSYALTKRTRNGHGVTTSQLSASFIGIREKAENPNSRAFRAAASKQLQADLHYPSRRSCHMQSAYPGTIVKLDPSYPFKPPEPADPSKNEMTRKAFVKDSFGGTQPDLADKWKNEYQHTVKSRVANSDKAHRTHIQFS